MEVIDIVNKLIGKTSPCGESNTDAERLENLKNKIDVTQELIDEISELSKFKHSSAHSERLIGETAYKFLEKVCDIEIKSVSLSKEILKKHNFKGRNDFVWNHLGLGVEIREDSYYMCMKDISGVTFRTMFEIKTERDLIDCNRITQFYNPLGI